jgi:hypothetical protein
VERVRPGTGAWIGGQPAAPDRPDPAVLLRPPNADARVPVRPWRPDHLPQQAPGSTGPRTGPRRAACQSSAAPLRSNSSLMSSFLFAGQLGRCGGATRNLDLPVRWKVKACRDAGRGRRAPVAAGVRAARRHHQRDHGHDRRPADQAQVLRSPHLHHSATAESARYFRRVRRGTGVRERRKAAPQRRRGAAAPVAHPGAPRTSVASNSLTVVTTPGCAKIRPVDPCVEGTHSTPRTPRWECGLLRRRPGRWSRPCG